MTCNTWHMTCHTWHVTCDMLWGVNILSKFQLPSFYCLWFGGKGWLTEWMNESINNEADCSAAPATPSLLKTRCHCCIKFSFSHKWRQQYIVAIQAAVTGQPLIGLVTALGAKRETLHVRSYNIFVLYWTDWLIDTCWQVIGKIGEIVKCSS